VQAFRLEQDQLISQYN